MKLSAKWLVAGGALLLVLGFLLPVIAVSQLSKSVSFSLLQIAGISYGFVLYLVPIGALAMIILALVPANDGKTKTIFLFAQIGGVGMALLLLLGTMIYFMLKPSVFRSLLPPQFQTGNIDIWPGIGLFLLLLSIVLVVAGLLPNLLPLVNASKHQVDQPIPDQPLPPAKEAVSPVEKNVYLEAVKGKLTGKKFPVHRDDFTIGRGHDNDLQLSDKRVSRLHARLRFGEGAWFIQDQKSKLGTIVNSKSIKATRLNSGDQIKIGDETFIFHM